MPDWACARELTIRPGPGPTSKNAGKGTGCPGRRDIGEGDIYPRGGGWQDVVCWITLLEFHPRRIDNLVFVHVDSRPLPIYRVQWQIIKSLWKYSSPRAPSGSSAVSHNSSTQCNGTPKLTTPVLDRTKGEIILHPRPTADPNDPLNWSKWYKAWNFSLVCFYTLMVFVNLDIGTVVWGDTQEDLGYTLSQNTWGFGLNTLGLAFGCILFIPFALKYGRRPVYILSAAADLATAIWQAKMQTVGDLYGSNLISGLAGAISETICQMTIADMYFVHQRGTANGVFIVMVNIGAFLSPVAAGFSAQNQGWRWHVESVL